MKKLNRNRVEECTRAYSDRLPILKELAKNIEALVLDVLDGVKHIDRVSFRAKSLDSFTKKAAKKIEDGEDPLIDIEDQVGGRVIVFTVDDIDRVESILKKTFNSLERQRKGPVSDSEFGYESNHLICAIPLTEKPSEWDSIERPPATFEIQIRTIFMHAFSEPLHGKAYKGDPEIVSTIKRDLAWVAASAWGADQAVKRIYDKIEQMEDVE